MKVAGDTKKIALGLAAAGLMIGIALALAIDFIFDLSVNRPAELEMQLQVSTLVTIPEVRNGSKLPAKNEANGKEPAKVLVGKELPWENGHFIPPFAEVLRDSIILFFEIKNLTHKPKLIAVTGVAGGEGTSTLAAGLAASISETGDGKVLLVEMNAGNPGMRPFLDGQPTGSIFEALKSNGVPVAAKDNLYLAMGETRGSGAASLAPKRFSDLIPTLRSSQFDGCRSSIELQINKVRCF